MALVKNRHGVLWDPETGKLDDASVAEFEKRRRVQYRTLKPKEA